MNQFDEAAFSELKDLGERMMKYLAEKGIVVDNYSMHNNSSGLGYVILNMPKRSFCIYHLKNLQSRKARHGGCFPTTFYYSEDLTRAEVSQFGHTEIPEWAAYAVGRGFSSDLQ